MFTNKEHFKTETESTGKKQQYNQFDAKFDIRMTTNHVHFQYLMPF